METSVYIPIISDYGFKATFGNEADSLFLRTALQALIKSEMPIREVHFDKNAFEALTIDSRSGFLIYLVPTRMELSSLSRCSWAMRRTLFNV